MNQLDTVRESNPAKPLPAPKSITDSESFTSAAKELVVANFNDARKDSYRLTPSKVNMLWFTQGIIGFKAMFCSPRARGLLWSITFNRPRNEMYVEVFGKMKNETINMTEVPS